MKKVYLVINNYSNANSENIDIENIRVFNNYDNAKKCFEEEKNKIKQFKLNYSTIIDEKDYYCEQEDGEYLYYHELVYIKEKEILEGC